MEPHISEGFFIGTVFVTLILTFGSVVGSIIRSRRDQRLAELRTQMQSKLLERFDNSSDALEFLRSEAGLQFAQSNSLERSNAFAKMLGSLQLGIVAFFVGLALFAVRANMSEIEMRDMMSFLGAIATALGLGFVLSSVIGILVTRRLMREEEAARPKDLAKAA